MRRGPCGGYGRPDETVLIEDCDERSSQGEGERISFDWTDV